MSVFAKIPLLLWLSLLLAAGAAAAVQVQAGVRAPAAKVAGAQDPALVAARQALAAGRPEEAAGRAGQVLARDPANREAAEITVSAFLEQRKLGQALATYDAYATARNGPDVAVLGVIARSELRRASQQQPSPTLMAVALEDLARDGDAEALRALKRAAASQTSISEDALAPLVSLVRLGDQEATARLGALVDSAPPDLKGQMSRALQDAGARSLAPKLVALLDDPQPQIRASAAKALGSLQFAGAIPRLQAVFDSDVPIVRMFAGAALKRLGQTSADVFIAGLLKSEVPEVRLIAAEAYQSAKTTQWVPLVRELLSDRNELNRLRAADLLARGDQASARRALLAALDSGNPLLRTEAARILEARGLADAQVVRRLLGDSFEGVRLRGAAAALRLGNSARREQ